MDLNIEQMKELIELFEDSNLTEISVSQNDYQVTLKKGSGVEGASPPDGEIRRRVIEAEDKKPNQSEENGTESGGEGSSKVEGDKVAITSPIVGTFYRSSSPEDPPYISVGDVVDQGDTVCIIEAMKVMNEVKADSAGEVVEVCVEDGDPVEYGQALFKLAPGDKGN